ncbi:MAG: hypothetical protein ACTHQQ_06020 [Solirubrobacteraceae bacterium]
MITDKAQVVVGAALVGVFAGFWRWHSPPAKKLTRGEIDHYLEIISGYPAPRDSSEFIARVRSWAEADDGKPILMLNLLRYFPELRRFPGAANFDGTPEEANAYYEKRLTPLWLRKASYPLAGGTVLGENLIQTQPMGESWSTAMMVRYPSRRTFLQLLADPTYADLETYKLMALEIDLVPLSSERAIPDLRWIAGGSLLALFLGTGWLRTPPR